MRNSLACSSKIKLSFKYSTFVMPHFNFSFNRNIAHFRSDSPMAMAGPFSVDNNVTLSVKQGKLNHFINICESAEDILDYYQIS